MEKKVNPETSMKNSDQKYSLIVFSRTTDTKASNIIYSTPMWDSIDGKGSKPEAGAAIVKKAVKPAAN